MNNKQETYPKDFLFADVIAHTLLNLYMTVAYSKRYVPAHTRNDILLRQLKGYCKSEKYKSIKTDIRRLINFGRKSGLALEHKMLEIQSMATSQPVPVSEGSDLARFQDCLEQLNHLCLVDVEASNSSGEISSDTLYLNREEVIGAFDKQGNVLAPIKVYIPSEKWLKAVEVCEQNGWRLNQHSQHNHSHIVGKCTLPPSG